MARAFEIIDGEGVLPTISFIDGGVFAMEHDGEGGQVIGGEDLAASTVLSGLVATERWTFHSLGASVDNLAYRQQALHTMLLKAAQYDLTNWQPYPVYLKVQQEGETSPRYAILRGIDSLALPGNLTYNFSLHHRQLAVVLSLVRERPWRVLPPTTNPSAITLTKTDASSDAAFAWLASLETDQGVTHIYAYDDSAAGFSANGAGGNSIPLWSVSGSTPAVNDMQYFGSNVRSFFNVVLPIATAGVFSADVVPQAYVSGAWTDLVLGSGYLIYPATDPDNLFKVTGDHVIAFYPGTNWQATTINGVNAYWVRLKLNSVSSWTTTPVTHASDDIYTQKKAHFIVPATAIGGDAPARFRLRFTALNGGAAATPMIGNWSRLIVGAKSRNLATFLDTIPLHNYTQPSGWARTLGTDTTEVAAAKVQNGYYALTSFATDITMIERVQIYGTDKFAGFAGTYRVLVVGQQDSGSAGDIEIKAKFLMGFGGSVATAAPSYETLSVKTKGATPGGLELVDLGEVTIPFVRHEMADGIGDDLVVKFFARRVSGAATWRWCFVRLIPTDEWFAQLDDPTTDRTNGSSAMRAENVLDLDLGVRGTRCFKWDDRTNGPYPSQSWLRSSGGGRIMPGKEVRFYIALLGWDATWGTPPLSDKPRVIGVQFYEVNSFIGLRGQGT